MAAEERSTAEASTGRWRALEHRAVQGVLLVAALLVAALATAAAGRADRDTVAAEDDPGGRRPPTTTTTAQPVATIDATVPDVIAPDVAAPLDLAPSDTAPPAGAGGAGGRTGSAPPTSAAEDEPAAESPPPAPPGAPGPAEPCGGPLPKPGGGQWVCTFSDEFDGTELDRSKWLVFETATTGWHAGQECMVDRPANVSVSGGALRLTARAEQHGFVCEHPQEKRSYGTRWTSGMVSTMGRFAQQYGRVEIRARFPDVDVPGVHSALWMWPARPNAQATWGTLTGEIDIAEFFSRWPDRVIPYLHRISVDSPTNNYCELDPAQFHTYVLEWTSNRLHITYDGWTCLNTYETTAFHEPFFLNLTQALGTGRNPFTEATPLPATMVVDHVRVWG